MAILTNFKDFTGLFYDLNSLIENGCLTKEEGDKPIYKATEKGKEELKNLAGDRREKEQH